MNQRLGPLPLLLLPLLLLGAGAGALSGKRIKVNKYAKFSKAHEVSKSLRFSNIDVDSASGPAAAAMREPTLRNRSSAWEYPDAALVDQRDPSTFGFTEIGVVLGAHGTQGELKVSSDSDFARERLCSPGMTWLRRPRRRAPREVRLVNGRKGPGTNRWLVTLDEVSSREEAIALKGSRLFVRRELRPSLAAGEVMLWELEGLAVAHAEREHADDEATGGGSGDAASDDAASDDAGRWREGKHIGTIIGIIPREELTGDPELGHDLLEVALAGERDGSEGDGSEGDGSEGDGSTDEVESSADGGAPDTVLVPFVPQIVVDIRLEVGSEAGVVLIDPPGGLLELIQPKRLERVVIRGLIPPLAASLQPESEV